MKGSDREASGSTPKSGGERVFAVVLVAVRGDREAGMVARRPSARDLSEQPVAVLVGQRDITDEDVRVARHRPQPSQRRAAPFRRRSPFPAMLSTRRTIREASGLSSTSMTCRPRSGTRPLSWTGCDVTDHGGSDLDAWRASPRGATRIAEWLQRRTGCAERRSGEWPRSATGTLTVLIDRCPWTIAGSVDSDNP